MYRVPLGGLGPKTNPALRNAPSNWIAFQLKNAADVVLAEVQHMEAAQERFAQKAKAKTKVRA